jgi:hypothetical protein
MPLETEVGILVCFFNVKIDFFFSENISMFVVYGNLGEVFIFADP